MAFTGAKSIADLLFAYVDQSGVAGPSFDATNGSSAEKAFIALALTQAVQEARKLNPGVFVQRPGIVLRAPMSGTITVTQYSATVTLGTLPAPPNDGCTIRIDGGLDNELNVTATPGTYQLAREHEGASGTVNAMLWHDCWMPADGTTYEAVLGDVRANGRPVGVANSADDLDAFRLFSDFGQVQMARTRTAGCVRAVLVEQWASPFAKKIQTRLRFGPMPEAATVVAADLVVAAPAFTAANILSTTLTFQIPQQLDETLLFPIALKKFSMCPVFRAGAEIRREINEQYAAAVNTLKMLRGHYAAQNSVSTPLG